MNNLSNNNYCRRHNPYEASLQTIGGDLQVQVDQNVHWETQDAMHLQADEDIIFNAEDTLTLQCGNSTMTLEGDVVTYTSPDFGIGENPAAGPNTTFAENRPILPGGVLCPKNQPESGLSAQAFADAEQTHASMVRLCSKAQAQAQAIPAVAEKEENQVPHIFSNAEGSELTEERIAAFVDEMDTKWLTVPKGQLTFDLEGKDRESSPFFSRKPHIPNNHGIVIGNSGVTFGRGLDLGQYRAKDIKTLFEKMAKNTQPLDPALLDWLLGAAGKTKTEAMHYYYTLDNKVPINAQTLTRKQQHYLFLTVYSFYEKETKRLLTKKDVVKLYGAINYDKLSLKEKDILVDLTYRGDNISSSRKLIVPALIDDQKTYKTKKKSSLYSVMNNQSFWNNEMEVSHERINHRLLRLLD